MIATILPGSSGFHAVEYNERKVAKGVARLLEMKNFGSVGIYGKYTSEELREYLEYYSSRNNRIMKPQFHLAISCKGHEYSEQELLEFAHDYLSEMGYGDEGQPLLVYSHYDTDNTHLHIITSRVAPNGRKINHNNERRRSQDVINRLLGNDREKEVQNAFGKAKEYKFSTFAQFKAIMTSMGYEAYHKEDTVYIKRGGRVQMSLPLVNFNPLYTYGDNDKQCARQLRSILLKYRDTCSNNDELKKELKDKLGIDILFFGKKDTPYGYMLVDHNNKRVLHGARVLAIDRLLYFETPDERFSRIESYIDSLLVDYPKLNTAALNHKLRRFHAYIKKNTVYLGDKSRELPQFMVNVLTRNNRISWVESFKPKTEEERDLLCRLCKVDGTDLVALTVKKDSHYINDVESLRAVFNNHDTIDTRAALAVLGYTLHRDADIYYAVNFSGKRIICLNDEGFDLTRLLYPLKSKSQVGDKNISKVQKIGTIESLKLRDAGGGSHGEKREWEVGNNSNYDSIDDGCSLKM